MRDYLREQLREMPAHRAIVRAVECRLMGAVLLEPPVLDLGCGDGNFASCTYERLPIDVGIDPGDRDLREARNRAGVFRHVVRASGAALPFRSERFRTVVSNCVIEHVPELDTLLREVRRVLASGGSFATTVPGDRFADELLVPTVLRRTGLPRLAARYGRWFNRISKHFHTYDAAGWRRRLEAAGLAVEEIRPYFSPAAHRRFDVSHYLGVPNLVSKRLFGRWVLFPAQMKPFEWWLRRFYEEPLADDGVYLFLRARKEAGS